MARCISSVHRRNRSIYYLHVRDVGSADAHARKFSSAISRETHRLLLCAWETNIIRSLSLIKSYTRGVAYFLVRQVGSAHVHVKKRDWLFSSQTHNLSLFACETKGYDFSRQTRRIGLRTWYTRSLSLFACQKLYFSHIGSSYVLSR